MVTGAMTGAGGGGGSKEPHIHVGFIMAHCNAGLCLDGDSYYRFTYFTDNRLLFGVLCCPGRIQSKILIRDDSC